MFGHQSIATSNKNVSAGSSPAFISSIICSHCAQNFLAPARIVTVGSWLYSSSSSWQNSFCFQGVHGFFRQLFSSPASYRPRVILRKGPFLQRVFCLFIAKLHRCLLQEPLVPPFSSRFTTDFNTASCPLRRSFSGRWNPDPPGGLTPVLQNFPHGPPAWLDSSVACAADLLPSMDGSYCDSVPSPDSSNKSSVHCAIIKLLCPVPGANPAPPRWPGIAMKMGSELARPPVSL